jgi:hypothetical protein
MSRRPLLAKFKPQKGLEEMVLLLDYLEFINFFACFIDGIIVSQKHIA